MSIAATTITSLLSTVLTTSVDTGNRALDTSIISAMMLLVGTVVSMVVAFFASNSNKNRIIACLRRQKRPRGFDASHYYLDTINDLIDGCVKYNTTAKVQISQGREHDPLLVDLSVEWIGVNTAVDRDVNVVSGEYARASGLKIKGAATLRIANGSYVPVYMHKGHIVYMTGYDNTNYRIFTSRDQQAAKFAAFEFVTEYEERAALLNKKECSKDVELLAACTSRGSSDISLTKRQLGIINSERTFDTLFYDQKQKLVELVERFKHGRMYPVGISMDNKLGILLHGPPGTGKTGTISAIANMLGWPVINVNLAEILLNGLLDNLMKRDFYKNHVIVLDEFDHMMRSSMNTTTVAAVTETKPTQDWASVLAVAEGEERKSILEMMKESLKKEKEKKSVDFGYFLQKLDGLECASGRIIIFCTNDPATLERNYPALFRPGRIDLKLCLGNCSQQMYEDILAAALELDTTGRKKVRNAGLLTGAWSPLHVINCAIIHNNLDTTLDALLKTDVKKI